MLSARQPFWAIRRVVVKWFILFSILLKISLMYKIKATLRMPVNAPKFSCLSCQFSKNLPALPSLNLFFLMRVRVSAYKVRFPVFEPRKSFHVDVKINKIFHLAHYFQDAKPKNRHKVRFDASLSMRKANSDAITVKSPQRTLLANLSLR
jgi:hypothetical protein